MFHCHSQNVILIGHVSHVGTMAFCLSHAGTQRDPPPPPPYWDIFDQWEQGSTCNGLLWASIFGPAGRKYRYLFHFVLIFYHCKFAVRCLSVSVISHGGIPSFGAAGGPAGLFTRWHRSLAVSHAGTRRDPPPPPPYWEPPFTNRHVVLSSSMPYDHDILGLFCQKKKSFMISRHPCVSETPATQFVFLSQ